MFSTQGNALAFIMLLGWFPVAFGLFFAKKPHLAALYAFYGSVMFLPQVVYVDFPIVPAFEKESVACLAIGAGLLLKGRKDMRQARPRLMRGIDLLLLGLFFALIGGVLNNAEPLIFGKTVLPGLTMYDAISGILRDAIVVGIPFLAGRALFRTVDHLRDLLRVSAAAGALYTPFLFGELWLSPQFHNWVYGFAQHSFDQTMRMGGYRPMVFMEHGLAVALFMLAATLSAVALARTGGARILSLPPKMMAGFLTVFTMACKSSGVIIYGVFAIPIVGFTKPKTQLRFAAVLAAITLTYPYLRATEIFPTKDVVGTAMSVLGADRAGSLEFRFNTEDVCLKRAMIKPWFGWGGFSRNRIFDEDGRDISIIDGAWILAFGNTGTIGFGALFGLLLLPVFIAMRRLPKIQGKDEKILLAALAVIVSLYGLDLLPNGLFQHIPFMLSGALYSLSNQLTLAKPAAPAPAPEGPPDLFSELESIGQSGPGYRR